MVRKRILFLLISAALYFFPSCGIPNYFDYESNIDFTANSISITNGQASIFLEPSIIVRILNSEITPIPTTPKIYLLYSISGTDSSNTSLISAFNSAYRSSISNYPSDYDGFIKRSLAPVSGADSVYFTLFPFHDVNGDQVNLTADIDDFLSDGNYNITITQRTVSDGFVLTLTYGNGNQIDLYRFNDDVFEYGITNYDNDSEDEFMQNQSDGDASEIVTPRIRVYLASTMGFRSYTNFMYAQMVEIANFTI